MPTEETRPTDRRESSLDFIWTHGVHANVRQWRCQGEMMRRTSLAGPVIMRHDNDRKMMLHHLSLILKRREQQQFSLTENPLQWRTYRSEKFVREASFIHPLPFLTTKTSVCFEVAMIHSQNTSHFNSASSSSPRKRTDEKVVESWCQSQRHNELLSFYCVTAELLPFFVLAFTVIVKFFDSHFYASLAWISSFIMLLKRVSGFTAMINQMKWGFLHEHANLRDDQVSGVLLCSAPYIVEHT